MSHLTKSNDSDSGCLWATRYQNCSSGKTHSKERGSTEAEQGKEPSWTSGVKPRTASCQQTADPDNKPGQDGHSPDQGTFFFPSRVFGPVHAAPEFPCPACCCAPWPSAAPSCLDTAHGLVTSSNTASALHLHQARSGATTWISESALPLCIGVWQQSADRCTWEHSFLSLRQRFMILEIQVWYQHYQAVPRLLQEHISLEFKSPNHLPHTRVMLYFKLQPESAAWTDLVSVHKTCFRVNQFGRSFLMSENLQHNLHYLLWAEREPQC